VYGKDYFLQQDLIPKILSVLAAHKNDFILRNFHVLGANPIGSCVFLQSKKIKCIRKDAFSRTKKTFPTTFPQLKYSDWISSDASG